MSTDSAPDPAALAADFEALYGRAPAGVWAAPGRVNVIGEHTDYNDGFVLPVAIPQAARLALAPRQDGLVRVRSAQMPDDAEPVLLDPDAGPDAAAGWAAYPASVFWALRQKGYPVPGADLLLDSDVPTGAGLSSSAALEAVVALALDDLAGLGLDRADLARICQYGENEYVGAPTGVLDQTSSLCCTDGHAMFLDTRTMTARQVPLDLAAAGLRLLVVDTLVKHSHADGEYGKRRAGCEAAARTLGVPALRDAGEADLARLPDGEPRRLARHVVTENARVEQVVALLDAGRVRDIGPLLVAGHASLRDDYRVSCPELDLAVDAAVAAGALGARMTGGGFGGSAVVLVEEGATEAVAAAVRTAFAEAGHDEPRTFTVLPAPGARRLS